jgi:hypothetical protein
MPLTEPAGVYRPRHPERTVVYRLFEDHFERYVREYQERYEAREGSLRKDSSGVGAPGTSPRTGDGRRRRSFQAAGRPSSAWRPPQVGPSVGLRRWNYLSLGDLDVLRSSGVYTQAPGSNPLADQYCGLLATSVADAGDPPPGGVRFHLVTGVRHHTESSLGVDGGGAERPNTNPCPR